MQSRFLDQAAAPALPRHDVAVDRRHVRRERQVEDRADVREQLVAAVGSGSDDRVRLLCGERFRPGSGLVRRVDRDHAHLPESAG